MGLWVGLCALSLCAGARHGLWIVSHCEKLLACAPICDSEPENKLCSSQISRKILKKSDCSSSNLSFSPAFFNLFFSWAVVLNKTLSFLNMEKTFSNKK